MEQNCIRLDDDSPNVQNYNPCYTIGRGFVSLVDHNSHQKFFYVPEMITLVPPLSFPHLSLLQPLFVSVRSQCMVSGSRDGTVRLWSLSLQTPVTAPPTYGYSAVQLRASLSPKKIEIKRGAIAEFSDVQSPIMCVNLTDFDAYSSSNGSNNSSSSSSNNKINGILVAAGSLDGTVMVWTVDLAGQGGDMKAVSRSLLFCHQLRPSERCPSFY